MRPVSTLRYHRVRSIAVGGMGRVDLAVRVEGRFRRMYAVKRLRDACREDPIVRTMFLEEARIAGLIRHPNVVSVLDVGEDDDGPFLVMDFVEGAPLDRLLADLQPGEHLPLAVCALVVRQIAAGLDAAHELVDTRGHPLGVVHRDVSPQNVLVGFDGLARLTDFGIASAPGHRSDPGMSRHVQGKLGYLSPEQLRSEKLDRRSDLFALGVVLHEMLTGTRLYAGGDPAEIAHRILREPPADVSDLRDDAHPALVQLLFELLAKDRDGRPNDASTVARRLDAVLPELGPEHADLALFMGTRFGHLRSQLRSDIAATWAEVEAGPLPPPPRVSRRRPIEAGLRRCAIVAGAAFMLALGVTAWHVHSLANPAGPPNDHQRVGSWNDVSSTP